MVESGQYQRSRVGRTGRLPAWFTRQPKRVRGDDFYVRAYSRLSTERLPFDGQIGPVPWSCVDRYGRNYGLSPLMHEWFVDLIMVTDRAYIERIERESQKKQRRADRKAKRDELKRRNRLGSSAPRR